MFYVTTCDLTRDIKKKLKTVNFKLCDCCLRKEFYGRQLEIGKNAFELIAGTTARVGPADE